MRVLPVNLKEPVIMLSDDSGAVPAVSSARPRLARSAAGRPLLHLDQWVLPSGYSGPAPEVGGRLNLNVDLGARPEDLAAAGITGPVTAIPWLDARVELKGPLFQPVEAEVAVVAGTLGALAVDLTPDSASVLGSLLSRNVISPLQVTWIGTTLVRLPAVDIVASATVKRSTSQVVTAGGHSRRQVARSLIEANARIEIKGASNTELEAAFREWALSELTTRLERGDDVLVRASAAQVVRWPIRLATTLDDLMSASEREGVVQMRVLDAAEVGSIPPVEVRVLGTFGPSLERVDVRLTAAGGAPRELAFTSDAPQYIALGTSQFEWSYRMKPPSTEPGAWTAAQKVERSYSLLVAVPDVQDLRIEALASGIDFDKRWSRIQVQLEHAAAVPDGASTVIELDAAHSSSVWAHKLTRPRGKVRAKLTFFAKQGQTVEKEVEAIAGDQLLIEDPLASYRRQLAVMPAGSGWGDISVAMIDLRYRDGEFSHEETVEVTSLDGFVEWQAPARPDGPRAVEWRVHASFRDGRFEERGWSSVESGVLMIPLLAPATRQVQIVPAFFDASQMKAIEVRFRTGERTLMQRVVDKGAVWVTLLPGPFRWNAVWEMTDGSTRHVTERECDEDAVVVPSVRTAVLVQTT